ncbi:MAG: PBP1A family penicillin-binding protein [Deltaproteobacteria bacterium]|nr:PBP1A family penicillin-binding protein [Deltaproteobacteria bacterium]
MPFLKNIKHAFYISLFLIFFLIISFVLYYQHLNRIIITRFETKKWEIPSKVFSSSYLIYPGQILLNDLFFERLERLGYQKTDSYSLKPGEYRLLDLKLEIFLHPIFLPQKIKAPQKVLIHFDDTHTVHNIVDPAREVQLPSIELEPELIALLFKENAEERRIVRLQDIPPDLLQAILAIEDERFLEHKGIDPQGILRALLQNLKKGRFAQGGSTLTQQLVKNFFLNQKKTLRRKITEVFMAFMIENKYSKDEILETYINEIYFGNRGPVAIHGVAEAALFYFSKDLKNLSLSEGALLAGMIQAPNRYSPLKNLERSITRRNTVLKKMLELKKITRNEYIQAKKEKILLQPSALNVGKQAPFFIDYVYKELERKYSQEALNSEGLTIFTTLDVSFQNAAQKIAENHLSYLESTEPNLKDIDEKLQVALLSMEPYTGYIKTLLGGRNYQETQFNRVFQAKRQPGSLFKPFIYTTAFELFPQKYTLTTRLYDEPFLLHYEGQTWSPQNYDETYKGPILLREALEQSINVPSAKLAWEVGISNIIKTAHKMGIESNLPTVPSLALGTAEVSPIEITVAYATLANEGFKTHPTAIKKVMDRHGHVLEKRDIEIKQILKPETAYLMTYLLQGVLERGTGRFARDMGFTQNASGKTGTTSDFNDAWFVGYTPDLVTTVWVGFDKENKVGLTGARAALPIWTLYMKEAHKDRKTKDFTPPASLIFKNIDPNIGCLVKSGKEPYFKEAFIKGTEPKEYCE